MLRTSEAMCKIWCVPEGIPFPILTPNQVKDILSHGKENPWVTRREHGWPYHTNPFLYLLITYQQWIPGLTREHIAHADPLFHAPLTRAICLRGMPEWLDVPTKAEARMRALIDPIERAKLEGVREYFREQKRNQRPKNNFGN
jgi:hypothetical protein